MKTKTLFWIFLFCIQWKYAPCSCASQKQWYLQKPAWKYLCSLVTLLRPYYYSSGITKDQWRFRKNIASFLQPYLSRLNLSFLKCFFLNIIENVHEGVKLKVDLKLDLFVVKQKTVHYLPISLVKKPYNFLMRPSGVSTIVQETIVQGDSCPRDFCPITQLSKQAFVQGDFCPRKRFLVKSLLKLIFLFFIDSYLTGVL